MNLVVASAAGLVVPNRATATATASSKKLDAPIIPAGAEISCGNFNSLQAPYAIKKIKKVCKISGTAINTMCNGFSKMTLLCPIKIRISVSSSPTVVTESNLCTNTF